ncbi:Aste57867_8076 [Aphanomyces stellatus]|uniref:Aste57867_8076 protein n=1 Tax=Aphanomyces stellatus TaxID=120398 RepID=A0A485KJA6_9STRA|nr:hypothetical protein As57867_008046 [Aphanomyces stellatus]VFT84965.1 Aste57867_8076 [Aphanomyces stellatus]
MYDVLNKVEMTTRRVDMPQDIPVRGYYVEIHPPAPSTYKSRVSIRRMRPKAKIMQWHPNNLTMKEIVAELQTLDNSLEHDMTQQALLAAATEAPVEIEHWVTKGHVVELWDHIVTNPCKANCNITRAILRDTQTMQNIAFLHAWHRWVVASALPKVVSFHNLFHATFEREPTWDFLANAFDSHAQVLATLPHQIGASLCEVEIALSAFEILLATQLTPYFFNESWLVCETKHPVVWLPIHNKANMVGLDTLRGLLHSFIGHELVADMRMAHPCGVFDTLARLQSLGYSYDKGTMVGFVPGTVPGLAFVTPYRM